MKELNVIAMSTSGRSLEATYRLVKSVLTRFDLDTTDALEALETFSKLRCDDNLYWQIRKATSMLKTVTCFAHLNSKDPSSRVGAMIVRPDFSFVSAGYNGLSRGMKDNDNIWKNEDPRFKYDYVQHAERNALAFSRSTDVHGCYVICNLYPCHECAGLLVQSGIAKVFYSASKRADHKSAVADEIFNAAGVQRIRIPGIVAVDTEPTFKKSRWDA